MTLANGIDCSIFTKGLLYVSLSFYTMKKKVIYTRIITKKKKESDIIKPAEMQRQSEIELHFHGNLGSWNLEAMALSYVFLSFDQCLQLKTLQFAK